MNMKKESNKIEVYTNKTCPYCKAIKEALTKDSIEFTEKDTTEFKEEWEDVANLTYIPTVPTLYYKNRYWVPGRDFNGAPNLINLLKKYKESEFSIELQTLERLKSFHYQMSVAFGRTDGVLKDIVKLIEKEKENEHKSTS